MNREVPGMTGTGKSPARHPRTFPSPKSRTKVSAGGRIVIRAEFRKALGLSVGDAVVIKLDGEEIRIYTPASAIRRAQEFVRTFVPEGVSLVDELIAERRAEAARE